MEETSRADPASVPGAQDPENSVENFSIVSPRSAAAVLASRILRYGWRDYRPLLVRLILPVVSYLHLRCTTAIYEMVCKLCSSLSTFRSRSG
jgi:hypothetical protein